VRSWSVDSDRTVDQNPTIGTTAIPALGVEDGVVAGTDDAGATAALVPGPSDADGGRLADGVGDPAVDDGEPRGDSPQGGTPTTSTTAIVTAAATLATYHRGVIGLIERAIARHTSSEPGAITARRSSRPV
jgi:hypothetical protein